MSCKVIEFLEELNPSDIGREDIDNFRIRFEGFTDECWDDLERRNIFNNDDVVKDIMDDWNKENDSEFFQFKNCGWIRPFNFGEDNVFFAIWERSNTKSDINTLFIN